MAESVAYALPAASGVLVTGLRQTLRGFGFSCLNATSAVNLRVGTASGKILVPIILVANQSTSDYFEDGIVCEGDLYVEYPAGTTPANLSGSVWVG